MRKSAILNTTVTSVVSWKGCGSKLPVVRDESFALLKLQIYTPPWIYIQALGSKRIQLDQSHNGGIRNVRGGSRRKPNSRSFDQVHRNGALAPFTSQAFSRGVTNNVVDVTLSIYRCAKIGKRWSYSVEACPMESILMLGYNGLTAWRPASRSIAYPQRRGGGTEAPPLSPIPYPESYYQDDKLYVGFCNTFHAKTLIWLAWPHKPSPARLTSQLGQPSLFAF